jgi:hypothetical protein
MFAYSIAISARSSPLGPNATMPEFLPQAPEIGPNRSGLCPRPSVPAELSTQLEGE